MIIWDVRAMEQQVVLWDAGINSVRARSIYLHDFSLEAAQLNLVLETGDHVWELIFVPYQAFRFTTKTLCCQGHNLFARRKYRNV